MDKALREKILIVDDDPVNVEVLNEILKPYYRCSASLSGEAALKLARSSDPPDLVLLDINMPVMDGYTVCLQLKANRSTRDIPVIFVTALDEVGEEARWFDTGAVDFITKPVSPVVVLARVRTHLKLREALHASEERRRFTQRAVGAYTFEWDVQQQKVHWSDEIFELFGLDRRTHEPSYETWRDSLHDEDRKRVMAQVTQIVEQQRELDAEWRVKGTGDPPRWVMARAKPQRDDKGRLARYAGVVMDITQRKQAEATLRQWADAFRYCAHGMAIGRPEQNTILACNPAYARMLGMSQEEVAGELVLSLYDPYEREHVQANIARSDRQGMARYETRMRRADGSTFPVQMDLVSVRDDEDKVIYRVGTVQDITERKAAQEALDWEAWVRAAIADLARNLIVAEDLERVSNLVLNASLSLTHSRLGYVSYVDEEQGTMLVPCWSEEVKRLCPAASSKRFYKNFMGFTSQVLMDKKAVLSNDVPHDSRAKGPPGWHLPIQRVLSAPALIGDLVVGHISVANAEDDYGEKDLSILERLGDIYALAISRIRVDEQLHNEEVARRAAEEGNRAKSEFLATVSHEVRTPLHNILGTVQTMRRMITRQRLTEEYRDGAMADIENSAKHLAGIIDDILEVSRIDAGRISMEFASVDLDEVSDTVRANLSGAAQAKGLELRLEPINGLPPVRADLKRLSQVLINVAGNAIKFTNQGWVRVSAQPAPGEPNMVRIDVQDTGPGVPAEFREQIFDRFERLDTSGAIPGTGLGLSICRKLISLMGGRIWVGNLSEPGAIFHITVPVWKE